MRRFGYLILAVCAVVMAVCVFTPAAYGSHVSPDFAHWPKQTVNAMGRSCVQPCLWIRIIDQANWGANWRTETLPTAIARWRGVPPIPVNVSTERPGNIVKHGTAAGEVSLSQAMANAPAGSITLIRGGGITTRVTCAGVGSTPVPAGYCSAPNHIVKAVVATDWELNTVLHELGHQWGLGHIFLDPNAPNPPFRCLLQSVMCAELGGTQFHQHDRDELARPEMYGMPAHPH